MIEKIKEEIFIDKPKENKNLSSDDEEPGESTPDENDSDNDDSNEYKRIKSNNSIK